MILQEGGYSEIYAPYCTLAIVETLAGTRTNIDEPQPLAYVANQPHYTKVNEAGEAALERIRAQAARYWPMLQATSTR